MIDSVVIMEIDRESYGVLYTTSGGSVTWFHIDSMIRTSLNVGNPVEYEITGQILRSRRSNSRIE